MKINEFNFKDHLVFNPEEGKLLFHDERMIIMSAEAFGLYMRELINIGGAQLCKIFLRRLGESTGRMDAKSIKERLNPDTDLDWLAFGPVIHTWEGIVKAVPEQIDYDRDAGTFIMKGTWDNSFFAEQYLKIIGPSKEAVCWMLTGYATGYASEFFGRKLLCKEPTCVAKGDERCRFEIRLGNEWGDD